MDECYINYDSLVIILDIVYKRLENTPAWRDALSSYKSLRLVCSDIRNYYEKVNDYVIDKYSNHLLTLINMFPDTDWNIKGIGRNKNVRWEDCVFFSWKGMKKFHSGLSLNPNIKLERIKEKNKDHCLVKCIRSTKEPCISDSCNNKYKCFSRHPNLTFNDIILFLQAYPHKGHKLNWKYIVKHVDLPIEFILNEYSDNYQLLKHWNFTKEYFHLAPKCYPWEDCIFQNPNFTWEDFKNLPDCEKNYRLFSSNPGLSWRIVRDNPDKLWDWWKISSNTFSHFKRL